MERKKFISSAFLAMGSLKAMSASLSANEDDDKINKIPPYLKNGETIAITSPAGYISVTHCTAAINIMEAWGFTIKVGSNIGKKDFTFGGTDEERLADF